jgi:Na+/proline symporter
MNGTFLAHKINEDQVLTLPDVFAKIYGMLVEVLVLMASVISFMMLLAGNLVGMGVILAYLRGIEESGAIWISSAVVWASTVTVGLFLVAYTDIFQGLIGWVGCLSVVCWFIISNGDPSTPPPKYWISR